VPLILKLWAAAIQAGMSPVKINLVAMRGVNDDEIESMVDFAITKGIDVRFIESTVFSFMIPLFKGHRQTHVLACNIKSSKLGKDRNSILYISSFT
jgi:molybdenum cofactor biosynthesis enzyme MoaA